MIPWLIIVVALNAVVCFFCLDLHKDIVDQTKEIDDLRRDLTQLKRRLEKVGTLTYWPDK